MNHISQVYDTTVHVYATSNTNDLATPHSRIHGRGGPQHAANYWAKRCDQRRVNITQDGTVRTRQVTEALSGSNSVWPTADLNNNLLGKLCLYVICQCEIAINNLIDQWCRTAEGWGIPVYPQSVRKKFPQRYLFHHRASLQLIKWMPHDKSTDHSVTNVEKKWNS